MGQHASLQHPAIKIEHADLKKKLADIGTRYKLDKGWWLSLVDSVATRKREELWDGIKDKNNVIDPSLDFLIARLKSENSNLCRKPADGGKTLADELFEGLDWACDKASNGRLEFEILAYVLMAHAQHEGLRNFDHKKLDQWEACLANEELGKSLGILT